MANDIVVERLTFSLLKLAKGNIFTKKFKFHLVESVKINNAMQKCLPTRFCLNGNTTGFHLQIQNLRAIVGKYRESQISSKNSHFG